MAGGGGRTHRFDRAERVREDHAVSLDDRGSVAGRGRGGLEAWGADRILASGAGVGWDADGVAGDLDGVSVADRDAGGVGADGGGDGVRPTQRGVVAPVRGAAGAVRGAGRIRDRSGGEVGAFRAGI